MSWKRIIDNTAQATFGITDMDFTTASNGSESENQYINLWILKPKDGKENHTLSWQRQSMVY